MPFEHAEKIAELIRSKILGGNIESIRFSDKRNPHFAKIIVRNFQKKVLAVFVELLPLPPEIVLTNSILWFQSLGKLKTKQADKLRIVTRSPHKIAYLCTALRIDWQKKIRVFDHQLEEFFPDYSETKKIILKKPKKPSKIAQEIISLAPESIQIQHSLLTFKGLPFVKIGREKTRFGIENQRQILTNSNWLELQKLVEDLKIYRSEGSPNKNHLCYKLFPEAWLESIIRNDISMIDANLILSPLYNQFRTINERIDLLAMRKDGRLVIIELKASPNREHLFQAIDYWQEIEKQRIAGNLKGLFGKSIIADQPSIVYLAAPHTSYHKDFQILADTLSGEIEIFRFDLSEKWRENLKITERRKL